MVHNYAKEGKWENSPSQVKRREARNRARAQAIKAGKVKKGDGLELDHVGYHRTGSLNKVPTVVVTRKENRSRQPKRIAGKKNTGPSYIGPKQKPKVR